MQKAVYIHTSLMFIHLGVGNIEYSMYCCVFYLGYGVVNYHCEVSVKEVQRKFTDVEVCLYIRIYGKNSLTDNSMSAQ